MKAIRTHEPAGISGLVFEEVPEPTPMFGDVLCGSGSKLEHVLSQGNDQAARPVNVRRQASSG